MTSTIKVNTVKDTASTDIIKKCGTSITVGTASDTTTVPGNAVRSNAIQASDGQNIISQVGATITLGATGDNIVLAGGATQSGFGRTGTVDWQTGSIKTSTFTAANGEGYFANTSGGAFTMNLPAGSAGAIVSVVDYTNTFQTNALTVSPNGSEKIGGIAADAILSTEGQSVTFVYVDGTEGWKNIQDSTSNVTGNDSIVATVSGACNTQITCGNFKIAVFKGPGTFCVSQISATAPENNVDYLVVGGGGNGSTSSLGGGGGGGFRIAPAAITLTAAGFPITVGAGGAAAPCQNQGSNSIFSTITSTGGGAGGNSPPSQSPDKSAGGSGGGIGRDAYLAGRTTANNGNSPPVSPSQGNPGGVYAYGPPGTQGSAGGGGAGGVGANGTPGNNGGAGGAGSSATPVFGGGPFPFYQANNPNNGATSTGNFAGGGGGSSYPSYPLGAGGTGGGGNAAHCGPSPTYAGVVNTGAGGGGIHNGAGGGGGSGIVLIKYKFK